MTQPLWIFGVYDATGNLLADLSMAGAKTITYALNQPATVTFQMPASHPAVTYCTPLSSYIKAYRQINGVRTLRFYGPIWTDDLNTGSGLDMFTFTAADPLVYLTKRSSSAAFTSIDRAQILKSAIDTTNTLGELGISTTLGSLATSQSITADYTTESPAIADLIGQYADAYNGIDTDITPIEISSGKIGYLNTYNRKGSSKPGAVFAYGPLTLNNSTINRTRNADNIANYITAVEDQANTLWQNTTSQNSYRRLDANISLQGDLNAINMSLRTRRYLDTHLNPDAVAEYRITPGPRAPRIFDDFVVGDTVPVQINLNTSATTTSLNVTTSQRVFQAAVSVDNNGREILTTLDTRATA